jgi:hypothetical protein
VLQRRTCIASLFSTAAAVFVLAVPLTASGDMHVKSKHGPVAHAALSSCQQAEEYAESHLYERLSGGGTRTYTIEDWWQGCHGPYENVIGKTQWATYPRVRNNVSGNESDAQLNVGPYGEIVYEADLPG